MPVRHILQRPQARIGLGIAAITLIGIVAGSFYLFGGSGTASTGAAVAPTLSPTKDGVVFTIDPSASDATFTIDEVLLNRPNTVVGKTNQVTGQLLVNKVNPSLSQIGTIRVDLSTLVTDNDFRNRALQNRIFETSDSANQYATFTATSLKGLPTSATSISAGQPLTFQITGDLTIHQVTRIVTFDTQMSVESATLLKGQAHATVRYQDFNLAIPSVPSVASVSDTVVLAISFTAHA
ncbi:MAG: hypothetical protein PVSMB4_14460 [Ktedonobacterales bacterium]